jgi:hypothetical protein
MGKGDSVSKEASQTESKQAGDQKTQDEAATDFVSAVHCIRTMLAGRMFSDSTELIREDRER